MAIFKYTLPSGANYVVEAPQGTTQAQADFAFYGQVAAGSLADYETGQKLSSQATRLAAFGLSRLFRGTAGVDITTVLTIVFGEPVVAPVPPLNNIPITNPVTVSDIVDVGPVTPVGPLTPEQTQAVIAQIAKNLDQPADEITNGTLGKYGLTPSNLEQTGYLKPGTSKYPNYDCAVSSPSVWTGKNGINSLDALLSDKGAQTVAVNEALQVGYNSLVAAGTIKPAPTVQPTLATGTVYTNSGQLSTATAAALLAGTAVLTSDLGKLVKNSLSGVTLNDINKFVSDPVKNIETLYNGAVTDVTQGFKNIGNNLANSAEAAINQATGGAVTAAKNAVNQAQAAVGTVTNSINGVAALATNAQQFGSNLTQNWSKASDALNSGVLGGDTTAALTGGVTDILQSGTETLNTAVSGVTETLTGVTSTIQGAMGDVTNLVQSTVAELQASAQNALASIFPQMDLFGKMGSFSVDFSVFSSDSLVSITKPAPGFNNTVVRGALDNATDRVIGSAKIPSPIFDYPGEGKSLADLDIKQAQNILNNLKSTGQGIVNTVQGTINQARTIASTATNIVPRV